MARERQGRIAFGQLIPPEDAPGTDPWNFLVKRLTAGTRVDRYGREWRLGPYDDQGPVLVGRIGFQRLTGATTPVWDERQLDFVEQAVVEGQTVSYAIRRRDLRMAFQIRPPLVKRTSFTGAMSELLDETTAVSGWAIIPDLNKESFEEWAGQVDTIKSIRIRVERPNPHYGPRKRVENLIEGTKSKLATIVLEAQEGESVDLSDPFVAELIDHVAHDYGELSATGVHDGESEKYDSRVEGAPPEDRVALEPGQVEVPWDSVRTALGQ